MTKPAIPQGQEIQDLLHDVMLTDRISSSWLAEVEQQIREIIAQELERKAIGNAETRIQMGMHVPDNMVPNPIDWFRAAANTVRGHLPVTLDQWNAQAMRMSSWIELNDRNEKEH